MCLEPDCLLHSYCYHIIVLLYILFIFLYLVWLPSQDDLDETMTVWNSHKIRKSRRGLPSGRPSIMFEVPAVYNTRSYLVPVEPDDVLEFKQRCRFRKNIACDEDVFELCCSLMNDMNLNYPTTPDQGVEMYKALRLQVRPMF